MSIETSLVGTPVDTVRGYDGFVVPDGPDFIIGKPFYTAPSINPCEFKLMRTRDGHVDSWLEAGWLPGKSGKYPSINFGPKHQLRTAAGWIYMPTSKTGLYVYKPEDGMHDLGRIQQPTGGDVPDSSMYCLVFNKDGTKLGGGSVATAANGPLGDHRPCVFWVDAATGTKHPAVRVGSTVRTLNGYVYYCAIENDNLWWVVGEEFWELGVTNMVTGVSTVMASEFLNGWGYFENVPGKGMTARLARNVHTAQETNRKWWLIDGQLVPFTVGQDPPVIRDVTPYTNPVPNMPQLDESQLPQHVMRWRPGNAAPTDPWTSIHFELAFPKPIPIDTVYTLPDNSVLWTVGQYLGAGNLADDGTITNFGAFGGVTEDCLKVTINGLVYFSGYANAPLYVYDPSKPWAYNVAAPESLTSNPRLLKFFAPSGTLSQVKRANVLAAAGPTASKIFMVGLKDRTGTGAGIGSYDIAAKHFDGHAFGLENFGGRLGMAVPTPSLVVLTGRTIDRTDAPVIWYDSDLVELGRVIPFEGLDDGGRLFASGGEPTIVVGLSMDGGVVYRLDLATGNVVGISDLSGLGLIGVSTQAADGSIIAVVGDSMVRIDPATLSYTVFGTIGLGIVTEICATAYDKVVLSVGAQLFTANLL